MFCNQTLRRYVIIEWSDHWRHWGPLQKMELFLKITFSYGINQEHVQQGTNELHQNWGNQKKKKYGLPS